MQHTLPLLISGMRSAECGAGGQSAIARLTSFNVAERFKLPKTKGRIAVGADATGAGGLESVIHRAGGRFALSSPAESLCGPR